MSLLSAHVSSTDLKCYIAGMEGDGKDYLLTHVPEIHRIVTTDRCDAIRDAFIQMFIHICERPDLPIKDDQVSDGLLNMVEDIFDDHNQKYPTEDYDYKLFVYTDLLIDYLFTIHNMEEILESPPSMVTRHGDRFDIAI